MDLDSVPSDDEIGGYVPLQRPSCSSEMMDGQPPPEKIVYSDDEGEIQSSSDDSDDIMSRKNSLKRKLPEAKSSYRTEENGNKKKKYTVWSNILQEEAIENQFIGTQFFDRSSRGNESYNYRMKYFSEENENPYSKDWNSSGNNESRKKLKTRTKHRVAKKSLILSDLEVSINDTNEYLATEIARKLSEPKAELIARVINALGKDRAIEMYNLTKEVEKNGGLLTLNGSRRRTSGGLYLKLVKDQKLSRKDFEAIFSNDDCNKNCFRPKKRKSKLRMMECGDNNDELKELPLRYELEVPNQSEESDSNVLKNPPPSPVHHVPSESTSPFSLAECFTSAEVLDASNKIVI